jgi:hypothetical protein
MYTKLQSDVLNGKDNSGVVELDGRMICITFGLKEVVRGRGLDLSGLGWGRAAGCCVMHGYVLLGAVNGGRFLDHMSGCQLLLHDFGFPCVVVIWTNCYASAVQAVALLQNILSELPTFVYNYL